MIATILSVFLCQASCSFPQISSNIPVEVSHAQEERSLTNRRTRFFFLANALAHDTHCLARNALECTLRLQAIQLHSDSSQARGRASKLVRAGPHLHGSKTRRGSRDVTLVAVKRSMLSRPLNQFEIEVSKTVNRRQCTVAYYRRGRYQRR